VSDDFKQEMKHNIAVLGRNLNLQPPDAALFVNGLFYDADTLDMATLLETLRSESRVLDGLHKIGMQGQTVNPLLALELSASAKEFAIDIRDSSILWINDLETDVQYKRWPSSLMDLLRPTFPGMMRNLRKNLYNLVLIVDPIKPAAREVIKLAESFVVHLAPLRLGFVLDTRPVSTLKNTGAAKDYRAINCAFNYVHQKEDATKALGFLTDVSTIIFVC
jgi:UDP-glucose:glycoprotein glucosyltransferase